MRNAARRIRENRTITARYLYTRRTGQYCRHATPRNSVHKSTSSWWLSSKFLDSEAESRVPLTPLVVVEDVKNVASFLDKKWQSDLDRKNSF
jgi:hypothetical protein